MKFDEAWSVRGVKGWAKVVLIYLIWRQNGKADCWPSLEKIAADVGCGKATVCRALLELERLGVLHRNSQGGRSLTRYSVNCPRLRQITVSHADTKERQENLETYANDNSPAKRELESARSAIRRRHVRDTFGALCELYDPDVKITLSMLARELGSRPSQVRTDMQYLIKNRDIPFDIIGRFGAAKPSPQRIAKAKAAREAAEQANIVLFARGAR